MKKMRKIIPALAMLLVSAIMMSTASFAWFTINDSVTATGMNIQAQASGSLVIKVNAKLVETDTKINVNFQDPADIPDGTAKYDAVYNLTPITFDDSDKKWKAPSSGATVDMYGQLTSGNLVETTPELKKHYAEYVVYLATGGAALTGQTITATITPATNGDLYIAPAYSVAFYVNDATTPSAVVHVDDSKYPTDDGCNVAAIATNIDIPSIVGATGSNSVGVKITMRVFVDGDLTNLTPMTYRRAVYTKITNADAKYDNTVTYYDDENGTKETNVTGFKVGETSVTGLYTRTFEDVTVPGTKYVNSSNVPVSGTTLKVEFATSKTTP